MKREIKFRVWLKIKKKMRKVQKIEFDDFGSVHVVGWFGEKGELLFNVSNAEVGRTIELMQFTGLKDKNGKEIYEGDIVIDAWGGKEQVIIEPFEVSDYENCYAGSGFVLETHNLEDFKGKVEVIGNIYENPELI